MMLSDLPKELFDAIILHRLRECIQREMQCDEWKTYDPCGDGNTKCMTTGERADTAV